MKKKRCKVVMLPTDKAQDSIVDCSNRLQYFKGFFTQEYLKSQGKSSHHLYIISDDKIEEDDWVIETSNSNALEQFADYSLNQKSMGCKKIIATTESELKIPYMTSYGKQREVNGVDQVKRLFQIPQSFIEEYCRKGGIDEVDVEYGRTMDGTPTYNRLIVNSDNTINIHPIKDTYTREEVEAIAAKFLLLGFGKSAEGRNAEILCESRWLEEMFPEHFESIEIFTKDNL